ncbi:META domain-containing protein [Euzebyella marina]|uniref:META domain-containing protein n=1 Tax=Euzebyella marina TaxID=1761453 RepID=A0A3G2L3D6_9FLAO|nr:META domain-containing protein [Euzebyella marina]AYN66745.1 META domain-containing protein [Euzebyella marina]
MKSLYRLLIACSMIMVSSCGPQKQIASEQLYASAWELEYITGPRIAFEGLYPDKKPQITFDKEEGKASGTNSCNGYSADFSIDGKSLKFGAPGPTTMMYCGEGEKVFLNTIKQIDSYRFTEEGKLELIQGDIAMMRFKKASK